ncbi:tRNA 5-methoxyuridine(34)/uridine 5-oxyacetic acid(34) synthase CmoB [Dichelobacter nodosus]|uniref:tRNA U34 carboxymethyltransferase n=1 Tax=Dichelobacter nodosus (strain VCS1703A) TaxID=246195 RepID=CMOB_DICNV|nr:tRNA 5-methoxyuridine(34)/uridine 5-oxyacetic acid(34) synthase CmoB [Dichelobacter nodosus]A5EVQ5.1 RecName: Full=tRNA U34 carboxymethyltransferase [Dichelobacter nodosus VCS1703A]ABQ13756.1 methyltransferase family protein [Dichelobacter nodosus VCS1703A]
MNAALRKWHRAVTLLPALSVYDETAQRVFTAAYDRRHKSFEDWLTAIAQLPLIEPRAVHLNQAVVTAEGAGDEIAIETLLKALMPWRKGPFSLCGVSLDCEWRSDFKYQRLLDAGFSVSGKKVLDVGTGNGYFLYRFLGSGAQCAVGVDPSWLYFAQFLALQKFFQQNRAVYLPTTLDDLSLEGFDCVLAMGVLYHRRDPLAFLAQLRNAVVCGGDLVIETLVVDGDAQTVYMPKQEYVGMHNVWFLPSIAALCRWLERLNFRIELCSEAVETTINEQRRTRWVNSFSLADFLQRAPSAPPPKRAFVIAKRL